jgi:hypothetical protein
VSNGRIDKFVARKADWLSAQETDSRLDRRREGALVLGTLSNLLQLFWSTLEGDGETELVGVL